MADENQVAEIPGLVLPDGQVFKFKDEVARSNAATGAAHAGKTGNPHGTTASDVGAYTTTEVDERISQNAAHYLTANVGGAFVQFATHAALAAAKAAHTEANPQFWYGDDPHTPDKNDYCIVLDDETHGHATTRYMFVGEWPDGLFRYQYTVNETALTQAQWDALNSGATKEKIDEIDLKLAKTDVIDPATATTTGKAADAKKVAEALAGKLNSVSSAFVPGGIGFGEVAVGYFFKEGAGTPFATNAYGNIFSFPATNKGNGVLALTSDVADATKLTPVFSEWTLDGHSAGFIFRNISATYDEDVKGWKTEEEYSSDGGATWMLGFVLAEYNPDPDGTATIVNCVNASFIRSIVGYKLGGKTAESDPTLNGMTAAQITTLAEASIKDKMSAANPDFAAAVTACFDNADTTLYGGQD